MDLAHVHGPSQPGDEAVLTERALGLVSVLHRALQPRRRELLALRAQRVQDIAAGADLDFLEQTRTVRDDRSWAVAEPAPGLVTRHVEITGPTDRKMTINALNSGADVWLADLEDANTPAWSNVIGGQLNLRDALLRQIDFSTAEGRRYELRPGPELSTIVVRPRGLHLDEKHVLVDGERTSGSFVDFALYLAGCAQLSIDRGHGPYFYLPKLESHLEARLWNDAFLLAQEYLGLPRGTIRATVLIETFPAAFEMEEILYELREHSAGLNAGRWDYMFSVIKTYRTRGRQFVLPDRNSVTMTVPFMQAYCELLVSTCHRRGAHAIGGMAAFIPSKDPATNAAADLKVTTDKAREAALGFDGSWVAHPAMVELCRAEFTKVLGQRPHQIDSEHPHPTVTAARLRDVAATPGRVTEAGLRNNISVAVQYLHWWSQGVGAVAIFNLMEDAATAEISRSQIWQWIHQQVTLEDGRLIDAALVHQILTDEIDQLAADGQDYAAAAAAFLEVAVTDDFPDFLTLEAYERMA